MAYDFNQDYYRVLGAHQDDPIDLIEYKYRALVRYWHPDRNNSLDAGRMIRELNAAYAVLRVPARKREYDRYRVWLEQSSVSNLGELRRDSAASPPPPPLISRAFWTKLIALAGGAFVMLMLAWIGSGLWAVIMRAPDPLIIERAREEAVAVSTADARGSAETLRVFAFTASQIAAPPVVEPQGPTPTYPLQCLNSLPARVLVGSVARTTYEQYLTPAPGHALGLTLAVGVRVQITGAAQCVQDADGLQTLWWPVAVLSGTQVNASGWLMESARMSGGHTVYMVEPK